MVGYSLGTVDGGLVGEIEGEVVGEAEGASDGGSVGVTVGWDVGSPPVGSKLYTFIPTPYNVTSVPIAIAPILAASSINISTNNWVDCSLLMSRLYRSKGVYRYM